MDEITQEDLLAETAALRRTMEIAANNWQDRRRLESDPRRAAALQALVDTMDAAIAMLANPLEHAEPSVVTRTADALEDRDARNAATRWAMLLRTRACENEERAADRRTSPAARACAARIAQTLETAAMVLALAAAWDDARDLVAS